MKKIVLDATLKLPLYDNTFVYIFQTMHGKYYKIEKMVKLQIASKIFYLEENN